MSSVIVTFGDKIWEAKGVTFHQDHYHGRVALFIKLMNNHRRMIYPADLRQYVDDENNFRIEVLGGELQPKKSHDVIIKIIDDNNIAYGKVKQLLVEKNE